MPTIDRPIRAPCWLENSPNAEPGFIDSRQSQNPPSTGTASPWHTGSLSRCWPGTGLGSQSAGALHAWLPISTRGCESVLTATGSASRAQILVTWSATSDSTATTTNTIHFLRSVEVVGTGAEDSVIL